MKLFEFIPKETGYDSFYVMSESLEEAIQAVREFSKKPYEISKIDGKDYEHYATDFEKYQSEYSVKQYGKNEVAFSENA